MSSERSSASEITAAKAIHYMKAKSLLTAFSFSLTLLPACLNLATPAACAGSKHHAKSTHVRNLIAAKAEQSEVESDEEDAKPAKSKEKKAEDKKSDAKVDDKKAKAKDSKEKNKDEKVSEKTDKADKEDKKTKAEKSKDKDEPVVAKKGFFNRGKDAKEEKVEKVEKEVKEVKEEKVQKKEIVKAKPATATPVKDVEAKSEVEKKSDAKEEKALLFEPDTALISVLKDLNRTLKEPEEQNKIEDVNQRMIVSLASNVLDKALSEPGLAFNRILAKEQESKARTRMAAEAWSSGDVVVNDKFHGSIATIWAKRIDGLVTVSIAGDCHDRKAKDGNDIGEFLVVITAKSPVETGFDIQSQANVNFWLGKLSNIVVEADCIAKQAEGEKVEGDEKSDRERKLDLDKKSDGDLQKKKSLAALPPLLTNRYRSYYEMLVLRDDRRRLIAQQLTAIDPIAAPEKGEKTAAKAEVESEADDAETVKTAKVSDEKKPDSEGDKKVTGPKTEKVAAEKTAVEKEQVSEKAPAVEKAPVEKVAVQKVAVEREPVVEKASVKEKESAAEKEQVAESVKSVDDDNVIVHTKPAARALGVDAAASVKADSTSTTTASTNSSLASTKAPEIAMVPTTSTTTSTATSTNFATTSQGGSTRPHNKQGNETAYAGAAASMERVTGLDLPALKQPKNFTMLLPDRALAGQPLTVAFVDEQQNPESNVELSFNGVTLSTDQNGQAQYMIPEDETPGRSLNVALLSRPYEMPSVIEVLQPLNTPASAQAPKVDRASHLVSRRSNLVIDGHNFDGVAQNNRVIIDGMTEATIAAASPVQLKVNLPKTLRPGPHSLCVSTEGMRSNPIGFELAQLEVACDPNSNRVIVKVVGTTSKVNVKLVNLSPELIKLSKGDDTKLLSSGGPDNTVNVAVQRIKKGNTRVEAWIEL